MKCKNLLSLVFLWVALSVPVYPQVSVGDGAPDFTYEIFDSNSQVTLSDYEGKVVYLFFFGANCGICRASGPLTESEIYTMFKSDDNFVALGLQVWANQTIAQVAAFKEITGITYPLLLDARSTMFDYYGNYNNFNRSLVIDANGKIAFRGTSPIEADFNDVINVIEAELEALSVSNEEEIQNPHQFLLHQNYPNPFNPATVIRYQLPVSSAVKLEVFDLMGRKIYSLVDTELQTAGEYSVRWDASSVPSGIYIYRLSRGTKTLTRKMSLIK